MSKKITQQDVNTYVESIGYILLSEYTYSRNKLNLICSDGHHCKISFNKLKMGRRCRICAYRNMSINKKLKYVDIKQRFIDKGFILLSTEYIDSVSKLKFKCKNGHMYNKSLNHFNKMTGCYKCKLKSNKISNDIRKLFTDEGYEVLSDKYVNCYSKIKYKCPNGHIGEITYNSFQQGSRCNICSTKQRGLKQSLRYKDVKAYIESIDDYKLVSTEYQNANSKLDVICKYGHKYKVTYAKFKSGRRCPICAKHISKAELEISNFIKSNNITIKQGDRTQITPYELDVYVPSQKLAIEYCGLYWHNDERKPRNYHRVKLDKCTEKGIRLITIFEDEWINQPHIVKSRLLQILGKTPNRLYARKCTIKELTPKLANAFYRANHLQGATRGKLHVGLYNDEQLVQAMSIGSPSRAHTNKGLELKRLATKTEYSVVGGGSKLLKYCIRKFDQPIRSHNDLRWGKYTDSVYEQLGFVKLTESKYTPHYVKGIQRFRNQNLRKTKAEQLTGKTEFELRSEQGYTRIWDCGHQTWEINK